MLDSIGWVATAIFSASYFFRGASTLRRLQAVAACLWIAYGIAIHAWPVVIANVIVAIAAVVTSSVRPALDHPLSDGRGADPSRDRQGAVSS